MALDFSARACYRRLLRLYPAAFHQTYAQELEETFADQRQEARYRGWIGAVVLWTEILTDLARSAVRLRLVRITGGRGGARPPRQRRQRNLVDNMLHDLRYSIRLLSRQPGFAAIAVLSLALGLGGTTVIFGLVDGLVLKPFSLPDADSLVTIEVDFPKLHARDNPFIEVVSPAEYADLRTLRSLTKTSAFDLGNRHISGGDRPERLFTALVFSDLFQTAGVSPLLGRGFTTDELGANGPMVAIVSHRIWTSRFAADPALVGRAIRINGVPTTVVGVMPPELLILGTDLWLPLRAAPSEWPRNARQFTVLARLAPGSSLDAANAELAVLAKRTAAAYGKEFAEYGGWRLTAVPWAVALTRSLQPTAYLLLGAIGLVLLIICVNIANLQAARASTRHREIAVRIALGAGHWRVARQLLIESLLIAGAGAVLGFAVARVGLRASIALLPAQIIALEPRIELSGRVLVVGIVASLVAGVFVGVLPSLRGRRTDAFDALKSEGRHTAGPVALRLRFGLIVAEISLATILLVGAGLLVRTMTALSRVDPGVNTQHVLTMRLTLPFEKYRGRAAIIAFFDALVERLGGLSGVRSAAAASQFPPSIVFSGGLRFEGRPNPAGGTLAQADTTLASPGLFQTLGIPLRAGRSFTLDDDAQSPRVAVVNEAFVRRFYQGQSPLGSRVALGTDAASPWIEIVGVVADTRGQGLIQPSREEIYFPVGQMDGDWNQLFLLIRTDGDPLTMLPAVRREIMAVDRDQPAYAIQTLEQAFATGIFTQRTLTTLLGIFASLALLLAAIGIYAIMSYAVAARTREIGIRIALGAQRQSVVRMVVGQVIRLVIAGAAIGLTGALAVGRLIASVLVGTQPTDPRALLSVSFLLATVALVAAYLPARRASRIDPVITLRGE